MSTAVIRRHALCLLSLALLLLGCEEGGDFALSPLFQEGMVLQQRATTVFRGTARPGSRIEVKADWGYTVSCHADGAGRWQVGVVTPEASDRGRVVVFECGRERHCLRGVLIGELWVAMGQASMQMPLEGFAQDTVNGGQALLREPMDSTIRFFVATPQMDPRPLDRMHGNWSRLDQAKLKTASAIGVAFARMLRDSLRVPIGIIQTTYGGAPMRAWTALDKLANDSLSVSLRQRYDRDVVVCEHYDSFLGQYPSLPVYDPWGRDLLPDLTVGDAQVTLSMHDAGAWPTMHVPGYWQGALRFFTGVLWFVRQVTLPPAWRGRDLELRLGAVDDRDRTYVNNADVGGYNDGGQYNTDREYRIDGSLVRGERATIAVRVTNEFAGGGIIGHVLPGRPGEHVSLRLANDETEAGSAASQPRDTTLLLLDGEWHYSIAGQFRSGRLHLFPLQSGGFPQADVRPFVPNHKLPSMTYNGLMAPLRGFGAAGVIAHLGEADMVERSDSTCVGEYTPRLVDSYRELLGRDAMVIFAQPHARWFDPDTIPSSPARARIGILEGAAKRPNTCVITTLDLSVSYTNRPPYKIEEGQRLALSALHHRYGRRGFQHTGPMPDQAFLYNGIVWLRFVSGSDRGLRLDRSHPSEVDVADADGLWHPAKVWLEGNQLCAYSHMVSQPVALRYAARPWSWATLWNSALPAPSFQVNIVALDTPGE